MQRVMHTLLANYTSFGKKKEKKERKKEIFITNFC